MTYLNWFRKNIKLFFTAKSCYFIQKLIAITDYGQGDSRKC